MTDNAHELNGQDPPTSAPSGWPGVMLGALCAALSLGLFFWHVQAYGMRWYLIFLLFGFHASFAIADEFNNRRREQFAKRYGLRVHYTCNQFGRGRFFAGYKDKSGELCDGNGLAEPNERETAP